MIIYLAKVRAFFRSIWNGIVGIILEILLVSFFIFAGFMICLLWWGIFR